MPDKKHILKIRCSDGLTTKPSAIRGNFIHEIRLPGGVLFPDLCSHTRCGCDQTSERERGVFRHMTDVVLDLAVKGFFHFAVDIMVRLKEPDEIVLMAHCPCGAAQAMGMSHDQVIIAHRRWQKKLQAWYPHIPVEVYVEKHSPCGEFREGHEKLLEEEVA